MLSSLAKLQSITCRTFATVRNVEACGASFQEIVASRNSCKKYKNEKVSDEVICQILSETITAPTSRNWQPYKIVIMKDRKNLDQLATTMFGKNADVVKQVPGVAIFLADTEPFALVEEYKGLSKRQGREMDDKAMAGMLKGMKMIIGKDGFTAWMHRVVLKCASKKQIAPEYYTNREWSIKQSVFPMELFVLSCQAHGLSTNIMEGFDGHRISKMIDCPKRYFITGVVPFGYADDTPKKPSLRYESKELVYNEKFGVGYEGIEEFKRREYSVC